MRQYGASEQAHSRIQGAQRREYKDKNCTTGAMEQGEAKPARTEQRGIGSRFWHYVVGSLGCGDRIRRSGPLFSYVDHAEPSPTNGQQLGINASPMKRRTAPSPRATPAPGARSNASRSVTFR